MNDYEMAYDQKRVGTATVLVERRTAATA